MLWTADTDDSLANNYGFGPVKYGSSPNSDAKFGPLRTKNSELSPIGLKSMHIHFEQQLHLTTQGRASAAILPINRTSPRIPANKLNTDRLSQRRKPTRRQLLSCKEKNSEESPEEEA